MKPRQDVVAIFSTFLCLEADRVTGWSPDLRLQRSMAACVQAMAATQSDRRWALYWHHIWQQRSHPYAAAHLSAYLQETCYWTARKIALNQRQLASLADFFQVAIARVPTLLKHFKPEYSNSLKRYAELGFENSLKDWLRTQQQVEICTDWALLYRLSRKRFMAALQQAGLSPLTIAQYTLAWECFQELATTVQPAMNALRRPNAQTWQAIAAAYNAERLSQIGQIGTTSPVSQAQIEQWLLTCAKSVRQFLKPVLVAADAPKAEPDSGSILDTLTASHLCLMDVLLQQEADTTRAQQRTQLHDVLTNAMAALSAPQLTLLHRYYRDQLTQSEIAHQMGIQQYQVSRQLERIRRSLLKAVAKWSEAALHISPTPPVVDAMSHSLEEWLIAQIRNPVGG